MEATATIESIKTDFGMVSTWLGRGKIATLYRENIVWGNDDLRYTNEDIREGAIIEYGRLNLKILQLDWTGTRVFVGLANSPHTDLYWLYRHKMQSVLKFVYRCERAVNGFMLKSGAVQSTRGFTGQLADKLL